MDNTGCRSIFAILIHTYLVILLNTRGMENGSIHQIQVTAWNMRCNFECAGPYLNDLMSNSDIICLSEHGLMKNEQYKMDQVNPEFSFLTRSYGENDNNFDSHRRIGGCAIGWNNKYSNVIKPLTEHMHERICGVQISIGEKPLYVISVYMPQQRCQITQFDDVLSSLEQLITDIMISGADVIITGDMNVSLGREYGPRGWGRTTQNGKKLMYIMEKYNMIAADLNKNSTGPIYTFSSHWGNTYLDHTIVSRDLEGSVRCEVLCDSIHNVSDHLALQTVLNVLPTRSALVTKFSRQVAWHKANADQISDCYTRPLAEKLTDMLHEVHLDATRLMSQQSIQDSDYDIDASEVLNALNDTILQCSTNLPHTEYNKRLKPYWTKDLTYLNRCSKSARKEWLDAGSPSDPNHPINVRYRDAKRNFRKEQRLRQHEYEVKCMKELNDSQEIDQRYFWFLVNKTRKRTNVIRPVRNDSGVLVTDVDCIREEWNNYYKTLYTENDNMNNDSEFKDHVETVVNSISSESEPGYLKGGPITNAEVRKYVLKMKSKKAPGCDKVCSEHLKFGGNLLDCTLAWLLNKIVYYEVIPENLKKGLITSIPKGSKDCSHKTNNRGITLLPTIYKLLETIMVDRENEWFSHSSVVDELQGAGQHSCSSMHTSMLVQEAIAHNRSKGESVYVAFLDIQKAFDTVWIS